MPHGSNKVQQAVTAAEAVETQFMEREQAFEVAHRGLLLGLPTDAPSLRQLSLTYHRQTADTMYEHGRVLIGLKHSLPHGEFASHLSEELGMEPRWAQTLMRFSLDCAQLSVVTKGRLDFDAVKKLAPSKAMLFARAALEAPEELAENGTLNGATLDEYDALTVREMRDRLRRKDKQIEAGREQLNQAKEKVGTLTDHLRDLREASKENVIACCARLRKDVNEAAHQFVQTLPREQKLGPLQLTALHELLAFNLSLADQINNFILDHYPAAEIAAANSEGRAVLRDIDTKGVTDLPTNYPEVGAARPGTPPPDYTEDLTEDMLQDSPAQPAQASNVSSAKDARGTGNGKARA